MKLRYKRSASLPSIELNRELARKIRRMLKHDDDKKHQEEVLPTQFNDLKLSQDEADKTTSEVKYEYEFSHGQLLQVRLGDISRESVDIIVCVCSLFLSLSCFLRCGSSFSLALSSFSPLSALTSLMKWHPNNPISQQR